MHDVDDDGDGGGDVDNLDDAILLVPVSWFWTLSFHVSFLLPRPQKDYIIKILNN